MKKVVGSVMMLVMALFAFAGCGTSDLKNLATSFVENVFAADYESASAQMEASFRENFTAETMAEMTTAVTSQYGDFESVISATVGNDPDYPEHHIVTVNVQFADGKMQFKLAYNQEKELSGLSILGSEEIAASSTATEDYRSDAKTFLEYIFADDVAAAYAMLSDSAKETYTEENLGILKREAESSLGAFDSFGPASQKEADVTITAQFEEGDSFITVTFDNNGKVTDLTVTNQE